MKVKNGNKHKQAIVDENQMELDLLYVDADIPSEEACMSDFFARFDSLTDCDRRTLRALYEATAQEAPRWHPHECPGGLGDPVIEAGYSGLQQATGGSKKQVRGSLRRLQDAGLIRRVAVADISTRDAARYQLIQGARRRRIFAQMQEVAQ